MLKKAIQQGHKVKTRGVPCRAHGATNKEHHLYSAPPSGEAAGSPIEGLNDPKCRMGTGVSLGEEAVLAASGGAGEVAAWGGRVRRATFSTSCES